MKIYSISDLHLSFDESKPMDIFGKGWEGYETRLEKNWRERITDDDLVLIAGDISWAMNFEGAKVDLEWIARLPGKKVLLRGNHDYWWKSITAMRATFPPSIYAVQNDCLRFGHILVAGTRGWTVPEGITQSNEDAKIYAREQERLKLSMAAVALQRQDDDKVFVMMHYPPFNSRRTQSPFTDQILAVAPTAAVYGHLHGNFGRRDLIVTLDNVPFYLTSLDLVDACPVLIYEEK